MRYLNHLIIFALLAAIVPLSGCSSSRRAFSKGEDFEAKGRYEEAMYSYADAFREDPETGEYRVRFLKTRDLAANQHFRNGSELFGHGDYVAALAEFQSAYGLDPTQGRFKQRIDETSRLKDAQLAYREGIDFEKGNKLKDANRAFLRALELEPANREYQAALARITGMSKSKLEGKELSLKSTKPITLKFKDAKLKDVFNIVTQLSGINFVFDETVKDVPVTIYLENATFQQVLDLLTNMFKLGRKVLNESTVIVFSKTPDKTKQYEDMVLRTFHLNYMEAKKAVNLIRTMIQVRKVYVNEDSNAVVVRDTADVVDVIEKILDANDVPDPEVVLDVEVVEISKKNAQNLGLLLSSYNVQLGAYPLPSGSLLSDTLITNPTTSGTTAAASQPITQLLQAFSMQGYGGFVTVPNATYNFGKSLANGEVLSNPKIRVKNKEKSKFTVGTRVPITTTSSTGAVGGVSVNVQYVDVGVKVNAEPNIQLNNEIVIKLSLEVSSILTKETVGGKDSPTVVATIGTRNLETVLSLKDGETSVIGGLIQNTKSDDKRKIFLLGDIPIIGNLLSNTNTSKEKTELILAITPRLVRGVTVPGGNLMLFLSGKEDDPSLTRPLASFEQEAVFEIPPKDGVKGQAAPAGQQSAPAAQPQSPAAVVPALAAPPAASSGAKQTQGAVVPAAQQKAAQAAKPAPPAAPQRGLLQISAPASITIGNQFNLEVKVNDVKELSSAPFVLAYDPIFVEFISASEGGFLKKDGKPTTFFSKADTAGGTVAIGLARGAGAGGVSGEGTLISAVFRAKNQGPASFGFRNVNFTATDGKPLTMLPFSIAVDVR